MPVKERDRTAIAIGLLTLLLTAVLLWFVLGAK